MTKMKMKNETLKILLAEIDERIDSFQRTLDEEITRLHVHLNDGTPSIAVSVVKAEMWSLKEVKEIVKAITRELETKA